MPARRRRRRVRSGPRRRGAGSVLLVEAYGAQDAAYDGADDAAQDEARAQGGEPTQDHADPTRPELALPTLAVLLVLPARVPDPARAGVGVTSFSVGHPLTSLLSICPAPTVDSLPLAPLRPVVYLDVFLAQIHLDDLLLLRPPLLLKQLHALR